MKSQQRLALRVGLVSLVMALLVGALIVWKSGLLLKAKGYRIAGEFSEVGGLLTGAEVRYRGYPIGRIDTIVPEPKNVMVFMWINRGVQIPVGSSLRIAFDGLIGEKFVDVQPALGTKEMIKEEDVLFGFSTAGLVDFVDEGTKSLKEVKAIIQELRNILTDREVSQSLRASILNIGEITETLKDLTVQTKRATDELQFGKTLKSVQDIVAALDDMTRIVLQDGKLSQNLAQSSEDLREFSKNLKEISNVLSGVVADPSVQSDLKDTVKHLREVAKQFEQLSQDSSFKTSVVDAVGETKKTLTAAGNILRGVGNLNVKADAGVSYRASGSAYNYATNMAIGGEKLFWNLGLNDYVGGATALNSFQQGYRFTPALDGRLGLFYAKPGVGFDWTMMDPLTLGTEFYDLGSRRLDLLGSLSLPASLKLTVRVNDALNRNFSDTAYGLSIGY